jgi:hypothetical protein
MVCPCCHDEADEGLEFCPDCRLPLVDELTERAKRNRCECDDEPIGLLIAHMILDFDVDAGPTLSSLTGLIGKQLQDYSDKMLNYNR